MMIMKMVMRDIFHQMKEKTLRITQKEVGLHLVMKKQNQDLQTIP